MSFLSRLFGTSQPEEPVHEGPLYNTPYAENIIKHFEENFPGRATIEWQDKDGMRIRLMAPTEQEPYYVAYTVGMSANLMELDNMAHNKQYTYLRTAELMMYLPANWPMAGLLAKGADEKPDPETCWPLRMLYHLACMPQKQHTWLGNGHSIPNGEPARPLAPNTEFSGAVLYLPADKNGPKTVHPVPVTVSKKVFLYVAVPVYSDEMQMKILNGAGYLEADLRDLPDHTGFIVTPGRPSVAETKEPQEDENEGQYAYGPEEE